MSCWWCGRALASDDRFCRACGEDRRSGGPWELGEDVGLWPAEGENRVVTALFPDLCGYMAASRQSPGDEAVALVSSILGTYITAVHEHGGFIARCMHDEVLALFGVPIARPDDAARALDTALAIRTRIRALGLDVKIGVNTGLVYFGPVGNALHSELAVVGTPVDIAARLVGKGAKVAVAGQILVGESTYHQARHRFELGEPVVHQLKGIRDPVTSYELLGARPTPEAAPEDVNDDARWTRISNGLDQLARSSRQLLQVVACCERPVEAAVLGRLAATPGARLDELVAAGWLVRDGDRYAVREPTVARQLVRSLLPARRAQLAALR